MAQAIRDAYGDIFLIKASPSKADRTAIEGKFKSFHNVSDNVASLMNKTFFALLDLADLETGKGASNTPSARTGDDELDAPEARKPRVNAGVVGLNRPPLQYPDTPSGDKRR